MPNPKKNAAKAKPSAKPVSDSDVSKAKGGALNPYIKYNIKG